MRNARVILALLLSLLVSTQVNAETSLSVGPEVSHITYREENLPIGTQIIDVKLQGVMYGVKATLEHTNRVYLALDGKYSFGQVDYSGTGTIENIDDYMVELRGLAGYDFPYIVLYSGYGYRYLNNDMEGLISSTGHYGYERESTYHYLPLGIKLKKFPFQAEIDILLSGEQLSHFETLDQFAPTLRQKQKKGVGFKASSDFKGSLFGLDTTFGPFIRVWKIQESEPDFGYIEPKNTSVEVGGRIAIRW